MANTIYLEPAMVPAVLRGGYRGTKFKVEVCTDMTIPSDAGLCVGGSRDCYSAINFETGATAIRDLYADVTARILAELATGAMPWIKPWSAMPGCKHPHNAATGRPYSGCNVVLLWMATQKGNWATMRYLTFKQAAELGGHVRKGETGTKVYFLKKLQVKDKTDDTKHKIIPMMKEYTLFNVAQCDGLPPKILQPSAKAPRNHDARDVIADEFMAATGADVREGQGQAVYVPSQDFIGMPAFASFKNADNFYSTVFHELGHWTGSKTRLDRSEGMRGRFGDRAYAAEELVAELCAAFLCAEFNMDGDLRHAGYVEHWIKLLTDDSKAIFTACSKAQAAADHLRELAMAA